MKESKEFQRCGARARTNGGLPCRKPVLSYRKRCLLHGGRSTGPTTESGKKVIAEGKFKHGLFTKEAIEDRKRIHSLKSWGNELDSMPD